LPASRCRSKRPQQQRLVAAEFAFGSDGTNDSFNEVIDGFERPKNNLLPSAEIGFAAFGIAQWQ
jgi:hypothetical protein